MTSVDLVLIAAVAEDGTIGDRGTMPWQHPEDLARFKRVTMGYPVILGRRTYESIVARLGTALPGRTSIVLTSQPRSAIIDDDDVPTDCEVIVVASIEAAIDVATARNDVAYVAGGASVYEQFLPLADRLLLTEVPGRFDGDTRFPPVEWDDWEEIDRVVGDAVEFVEYARRSGS